MNKRTCRTCESVFTPTHGRQQFCGSPCTHDRHPKYPVPCAACGQDCFKEKRSSRYAARYCDELCRDFARWGGTSCQLPADHWARWIGRTSDWAPPVVRNTGQCAWCGQANSRHQSAAFCSPKCKDKAKRMRRRGKEYNASGTYTWAQVVNLWIVFDKTCAYCRQPTPLTLIEPDHVVALAAGGDMGITNLLPSCKTCNSDKRELTLTEWEADRERRGLSAVTTRWEHTDIRYEHLTSTLVPMLAA